MQRKSYLKTQQHHLSHNNSHSQNILNQSIYNPPTQMPLNKKYWWQAFGMFGLIIMICFLKPFYGFDIWITIILTPAMMLSVKQSGAHYNPAMTLSNFFIKFYHGKLDLVFIWNYFKAQFISAFLAYNLAFYMNGYYYPPKSSTSYLQSYQIIISQIIGTFMLVVLIQKTVNTQTTFTTCDIETFSFICVYVFIARRFAVLSGNSINAVATLAAAVAAVIQCNFDSIGSFHLYLIGDFIGSLLGAWFYNNMLQPAIQISRKQKYSQQHNMTNILSPHINKIQQSCEHIPHIMIEQYQQQMIQINKITEIHHHQHSDTDSEHEIVINILENGKQDREDKIKQRSSHTK